MWAFEAFGYTPCELCLAERYAFYAGAPIAALTAYLASRGAHGAARGLFALLALVFAANVGLAFYHVGVEQHWWAGPTACTGSLSGPVDANDLMKSLNGVTRRQLRRGRSCASSGFRSPAGTWSRAPRWRSTRRSPRALAR